MIEEYILKLRIYTTYGWDARQLTLGGRLQMQLSGEAPRLKHGDFFLVVQGMVLGHQAKF